MKDSYRRETKQEKEHEGRARVHPKKKKRMREEPSERRGACISEGKERARVEHTMMCSIWLDNSTVLADAKSAIFFAVKG